MKNKGKTHVHINAIGSHSKTMQEIGHDVLNKAVVIADQLQAVLAESGEIIQAIEKNQLEQKSIIEIGHWLSHKDKNYKNNITVFKSVGLAIQNLSVAEIVSRNALKNNLGMLYQMD